VEEVVQREGPAWALTGQPWTFDAQRWQALGAVRQREAGLMRAFAAGQGCLMRFLQEALDDPAPSDCGRCSVCTGRLPAPGAQPGAARVEAARAYARGQDVVIEPRKLWPTGGARKGRITGCGEGRALAFADDPGWADALLPLFAAADAEAPQSVLDGVVAVLGRWRRNWGTRPVAVVPMPSATHPRLVASVAAHVAHVGRLQLVDALRLAGPLPDADLASGAKVAALNRALALQPGVGVPQGPLLLVADRYRSGWAVTVAAALLRETGAGAVLPLVLHQAP
jgi:ATP-dependent DNA helicase RecQ